MRCTMKSLGRAAGWDGCWDDGTGGSGSLVSSGIGAGLWIGAGLRIFAASAAKMDKRCRRDFSAGGVLDLAGLELRDLRRGYPHGLHIGIGPWVFDL